MKNLALFLIFSCSLLPLEMVGQKQPAKINFENGSMEEIIQLATLEDKLIFIDCYTSWCAPCKWMDKNVFVKKDVANFYNTSFVNYKLDMEKGEGPTINEKYGVSSYPTYLFINANGELIHKATSKMSAEAFIAVGKSALDPMKSVGKLAEKYAAGTSNFEETLNYAIALKKMRDQKADSIKTDLLSKVDTKWYRSLSGWKLIDQFVYDDQDELFAVLKANHMFYIDLVGSSKVNKIYQRAVQRNMYKSSSEQNESLFFSQLDSIKKLGASSRDLAILHSGFYVDAKNAEMYVKTTNYYVENFLQQDPETIAFLARNASYRAKDNDGILAQTGVLISKAYEMENPSYGTVGTYAQIQSQLGNKDTAIKAAELALKMADTISSKIKKIALKNLNEIKEIK